MRDSHSDVRRAPIQHDIIPENKRFSEIPSAVEIVIGANGAEEAVEINLETIPDDSTELCTLLENEGAAKKYWMTIAQAYAKYHKIDQAIEVLTTVLTMIMPETSKERLPALSCLAWLYLWKSREAPRLSIGVCAPIPLPARVLFHWLSSPSC
jgi:RNA polymerase-associated protein CTR9